MLLNVMILKIRMKLKDKIIYTLASLFCLVLFVGGITLAGLGWIAILFSIIYNITFVASSLLFWILVVYTLIVTHVLGKYFYRASRDAYTERYLK